MNIDYEKSNTRFNHPLEPLDHDKRAALEEVCTKLGLGEIFEQLELIAQELHGFEIRKKPDMRTPRSRVKGLKTVEKLAIALHKAIENLHPSEQMKLWEGMPPDGLRCGRLHDYERGQFRGSLRMQDDRYEVSYPSYPGRVGHIGIEASRLAESCRLEILAIGEDGIDGGRKQTLTFYASYVGSIWITLEGHMKLGRGGDFERLCDAVFKAAGVPSNAEGAVRLCIDKLAERMATFEKEQEETGG